MRSTSASRHFQVSQDTFSSVPKHIFKCLRTHFQVSQDTFSSVLEHIFKCLRTHFKVSQNTFKQTSQELWMMSPVTLYWEVTMNVWIGVLNCLHFSQYFLLSLGQVSRTQRSDPRYLGPIKIKYNRKYLQHFQDPGSIFKYFPLSIPIKMASLLEKHSQSFEHFSTLFNVFHSIHLLNMADTYAHV